MTNREKYAEQILDIAVTSSCIAVDKKGKLHKCNELDCIDCIFSRVERSEPSCKEKTKDWSEQEYVEPPVDWSKVPVDTKVYVRDKENDKWLPRYFARLKYGNVYVYRCGATSFSAADKNDVYCWNFVKLAEDTV